MQVKQEVRAKSARRFSITAPALAPVAMFIALAACGTAPTDYESTG